MFNSMKKKNKTKQTKTSVKVKKNEIELKLNEYEKGVMSDLQKQYLKDELNELSAIKENNVDISAVYFSFQDRCLEVKVFIRNNFLEPVNFENIPLEVCDSNENIVARKMFNLSSLGTIEPKTAKVYKLYFEDKYIINKNFNSSNLKLKFENNIKCFKNVETKIQNLPEDTEQSQIERYNRFIDKLPKLEQNTVSMSAAEIVNYDNGNIGVIVILRNGYAEKEVKMENIPATLFDKSGKMVATGSFSSRIFDVKPLSASVYNLVFSGSQIVDRNYDLTQWKVIFEKFNIPQVN